MSFSIVVISLSDQCPSLLSLSAYLINVLLCCCGVGQKLVVQPGLLYGSLHIIAKPQVVDDGLKGEGSQDVSTAPEQGQGERGRKGWAQGIYQCGGCSDLCAS